MTPPTHFKKYWDISQLAVHLGVKKGWVYERTREGGPDVIPHLKLGKYLRFSVESHEFKQWLEGKLKR